MMSKKIWTIEETTNLIELYREEQNLWNPKHCDYKNRIKRNDSLKKIGDLCGVTAAEIDRKLKNILSQYRRERRNYKKYKKSGSAAHFRAKWFGYNLMGFLHDKNKARRGLETMDLQVTDSSLSSVEDEDELLEMTQTATETQEQDQVKQFEEEGNSAEAIIEKESTIPDVPSTSKQGIIKKSFENKKKYVTPKEKKEAQPSAPAEMVKLMKNIYEQREKTNNVDEFDVYGELVARKLRNLSTRYAQITVQAMLNNILYEAELGQYDAPPRTSHDIRDMGILQNTNSLRDSGASVSSTYTNCPSMPTYSGTDVNATYSNPQSVTIPEEPQILQLS